MNLHCPKCLDTGLGEGSFCDCKTGHAKQYQAEIKRAEVAKCQKCLDTGFEANNFCDCKIGRAKRTEMLLKESGIEAVHWHETLSAFKPVQGSEDALRATKAMARGKLNWLLLYGGVGNGKTRLAYGIVLDYIKQGKVAQFIYCPSLLSSIRYERNEEILVILRKLKNVPLLVMDDFYYATDWEGLRLEEIINERYMRKLPLVLTMNKDISTIPASILSRFREMGTVCINKAPDYRGKD